MHLVISTRSVAKGCIREGNRKSENGRVMSFRPRTQDCNVGSSMSRSLETVLQIGKTTFDNRNTQPSDIRGNYAKYTDKELRVLKAKDEEIKQAERLQYGVDTSFKLLFLGGSEGVDRVHRRMFRNCRVLTAGNHYGADILGNWEENGFWEVIRQENPTCIVLDYGSDSWLNSLSKTLLMSTVNDLGCIFMFSPWRDIDVMDDGNLEPEPNMMYTETPLRYNATVFSDQEVLFTFWNKLEERDTYPSEILNQINTEWATVDDMDVEERKLNYNARNAFSNWDNRNSKSQSFIDAVKSQISMFTSCADTSSSFGWGATALQRVQPISRTNMRNTDPDWRVAMPLFRDVDRFLDRGNVILLPSNNANDEEKRVTIENLCNAFSELLANNRTLSWITHQDLKDMYMVKLRQVANQLKDFRGRLADWNIDRPMLWQQIFDSCEAFLVQQPQPVQPVQPVQPRLRRMTDADNVGPNPEPSQPPRPSPLSPARSPRGRLMRNDAVRRDPTPPTPPTRPATAPPERLQRRWGANLDDYN